MIDFQQLEQKIAYYVHTCFQKEAPQHLYYHSYAHTKEVVERVKVLVVLEEGKTASTLWHLLSLAAWLHDIGYLYGYENHEELGMEIAAQQLKAILPTEELTLITNSIYATKLEVDPTDTAGALLKDADLSYGITERFFERGKLLRKEWKMMRAIDYKDQAWDELQYRFLCQVDFFSKAGHQHYAKSLQENILQQKKLLDRYL